MPLRWELLLSEVTSDCVHGCVQSNFKRQPKIPAQLLRDFTPKGPLYCIASKCDDIMAARDLRRIEWANPNKRKEVGGVAWKG